MPNTGYNVMYPFAWLHTAGDATGDQNFQSVNQPEGDFFSLNSQTAGPTAGAPGVTNPGAWHPDTGMATTGGADATYSGYINAALMNPGSQLPVAGTPALINGDPNQGPVSYSDYATGTLPVQYLSPMPAWKNAPMQSAHAALPSDVQGAAASAAVSSVNAGAQHTHAQTYAGNGSGCAGCNGGCGGGRKCQGRNPALQLDSTNDFLPLYAHPTANAAQAVGAYLYQTTSTKTQAWGTSQGVPSDHEVPLQGQ